MEPTVQPTLDGTRRYLAFLSVIILSTALITGGGVSAYLRNRALKGEEGVRNQIEALQNELYAANTPTPTPYVTVATREAESSTADTTANWPQVDAENLNFRFRHPVNAAYEGYQLDGTTGTYVRYLDSNGFYPKFSVVSSDFTIESSVPYGLVNGSLSSADSFTVTTLETDTLIREEVAPGMYHVTGYGNNECTPYVYSYLFVRAPQNSNLQYISFHLEGGYEPFTQSAMVDECTPASAEITAQVAATHSNPMIREDLRDAVRIAQTFSTQY